MLEPLLEPLEGAGVCTSLGAALVSLEGWEVGSTERDTLGVAVE